jgi:lipoprotein-anchoring transpeptidase ErfK/SrfK
MTRRGTTWHAARRGAVLLSAAGLLAAGCTSTGADGEADRASGRPGDAQDAQPVDTSPDVTVTDNVDRRGVAVDTALRVEATDGTLRRVRVTGGPKGERQRVQGELNGDATTWKADELQLEPGVTYRVRTVAVDADDRVLRQTRRFRTENLSLDEQTYPSIAPLDGETVGVGMPVVVTFDVPVTDRASIERHLEVEAKPQVRGTWHWLSDTEVHYRPRRPWEPGTKVTVDADINSVDAGNGIYGQLDRSMSFRVGDSVVSRVKVDRHIMNVVVNGDLARRIPISAGKAGFETRSGTKLIMEKFETKRMDAATTGIERGDPEYYNIGKVPYAMRVTYSGEFLHGAPWSVGSQGSANVSHGCVGMSVEDAQWLYSISKRGDMVRVSGTDRGLEQGNGWTDWDVSFKEYKKGSALS